MNTNLLIRISVCVLITFGSAIGQDPLTIPDDVYAAVHALPAHPSAAKGTRIRLLDSDGQVMVGATVLVPDMAKAARMQSRWRELQEEVAKRQMGRIEQMLVMSRFYVDRYVTDAAGEVVIAPNERASFVLAVRGKAVVRRIVPVGSKTLEFRLPVFDPIHVLVVDPQGNPVAGVEVVLGNEPMGMSSRSEVTDDAGRILVGRNMLDSRSDDSTTRTVSARIVSEEVVGVDIDTASFRNTAEKPLRLQLPDTGSLEVEVLDTEGVPLDVDTFTLGHADGEHEFDYFDLRNVVSKTEDGKVSFPFVQTGLKLVAALDVKGGHNTVRKVIEGPAKPGEECVVQITGIKRAPEIKVRLLGVDGEPVSKERVGVLFTSERRHSHEEVETDAFGNLRIFIPEHYDDKVWELRIQRVRLPEDPVKNRWSVAAYLGAYRAPLREAQRIEAGSDLRLQPSTLVLGGRIVDEQGEPVAGVTLRLPENYSGSNSGGGSGSQYFFEPRIVTGVDGRFEFREIAEPRSRLALQVVSQTHRAVESLQFEPGSSDVTIPMVETFTIHGKILGVPGVAHAQLQIMAVRDGGGADASASQSFLVEAGGVFKILGCLPGDYRVHIKSPEQRILHTFENVRVVKGEDTRDYRLMAHDPSDYARWLEVDVVDEAGRAVAGCEVRIFRGRNSYNRKADSEGRLTILSYGEGAVIEVRHEGYRSQRLENLKAHIQIELSPSYRARLTMTNLPELEIAHLEVSLGGGDQPQLLERVDGAWAFEVKSAGSHELTLTVLSRVPVKSSVAAHFRRMTRDREQVLIRRVAFDVKRSAKGEVPVPVVLSQAELEFLKIYDDLMRERRAKR